MSTPQPTKDGRRTHMCSHHHKKALGPWSACGLDDKPVDHLCRHRGEKRS